MGPIEDAMRVRRQLDQVSGVARHAANVARDLNELAPFANWFREEIAQRSWSQEMAARSIGVTLRTVQRWIHGTGEPRLSQLRKIREALGPIPDSIMRVLFTDEMEARSA